MFEEPRLHVELEEDVESLLEMDDLEGVATGDIDSAFYHSDGSECATKLVNLFICN